MSFWTGLITVFAFSQGRFSEKQVDIENIDPPLPARYFTSRFRYHSSALVFSGGYVILYVALIVMGSLPVFQDILKPLFGSLTGNAVPVATPSSPGEAESAAASTDIGTPAWAAMVMMVVAPTVPWVRRIERSFRLWLQEFSDTPFKARGIADELIQTLLPAPGTPQALDFATESQLVELFQRLEELRRALTSSGRNKRDQRYREFFGENGEIVSATVNQFHEIAKEIGMARRNDRRRSAVAASDLAPRPSAPHTQRAQMTVLVRRFARLIACALLYAESEEFAVRERLREMPHLSNFARASFQFTLAQVLLAIFMIALVAMISGASVSFLNTYLVNGEVAPAFLLDRVREWIGRGMILAVAFVLPLFLVAAIRLYLIDMRIHGRGSSRWHETMTILLLAFVGCYGLSALPIVAYDAYNAGADFKSKALAIALFWAMPPAFVNAAFVHFSEVGRRGSTWREAFSDFALFAALGGGAAFVSASFIVLMYMLDARDFSGFFGNFRWEAAYIVTITLVSGLNGALQCGASRVVTGEALARAASRTAIPVAGAPAGQVRT